MIVQNHTAQHSECSSQDNGKHLHRLRESQAVILHKEGKNISSGPAAKTVEHLLGLRYGEGSGLLVVEGAEPEVVGTLLLKMHILSHDIHNVIP